MSYQTRYNELILGEETAVLIHEQKTTKEILGKSSESEHLKRFDSNFISCKRSSFFSPEASSRLACISGNWLAPETNFCMEIRISKALSHKTF